MLGFAYLLWAVHELAARGNRVELELVGDGPERGALSQLAQQLGIAQQIRWRGWVPFAQVREAMLDATILVHPSEGLGDGLPNVLREAMALGTPVIASRVAGIPEALNEGQCGVLVPPRDVPALADAIAALLADPDRRRLFADRGRAWTEAQFDTWRNGARLAEALRATARGQHSPARSPSVTEPAVEIPTW